MNINDFHPLREKRVVGKMLLSFANVNQTRNKTIYGNVEMARFFMGLGVKKVQLLVNDDMSALAVAESNDGTGSQVSTNTIGFSNKNVKDAIIEKLNLKENEGARFIGVPDEKSKAVFFELKNPVYF